MFKKVNNSTVSSKKYTWVDCEATD